MGVQSICGHELIRHWGNFLPLILFVQTITTVIFFTWKESNELPKLHLIFIVFNHLLCFQIQQFNDFFSAGGAVYNIFYYVLMLFGDAINGPNPIKWYLYYIPMILCTTHTFFKIKNALKCDSWLKFEALVIHCIFSALNFNFEKELVLCNWLNYWISFDFFWSKITPLKNKQIRESESLLQAE